MATEVLSVDEFTEWYEGLSEAEQESIRPAVRMLEVAGPTLGYPQSSAVKGSRFAMRELRVQHAGRPYRILYAFDSLRQAILLLGGDKSGYDRWYETAIRKADRLFADYLRGI